MRNMKLVMSLSASFALINCGDADDIPVGIKTPTCDEGQYYDGTSCVAAVQSFVGEASFRDAAFQEREAALENFLTTYGTEQLAPAGLSLTDVACTDVVESGGSFNNSFYNDQVSLNCGFTIKDGATEVLKLEYDETKKEAMYLKVVQNPLTDISAALLCSVGEIKEAVGEVNGTYSAEDKKGENAKIVTTTSCSPFGATPAIPSFATADSPAGLKSMPHTIWEYVTADRTKQTVSGDTNTQLDYVSTINFANDQTLGLTCDSTSYALTAELQPSADSPVSGKVNVKAMAAAEAFFAKTTLTDVAEPAKTEWIKSRSLLGCGKAECLTKAGLKDDKGKVVEKPIEYTFFGDLLALTRDGNTDLWRYDSTSFTYVPASDGNSAACEFSYTAQEKEKE